MPVSKHPEMHFTASNVLRDIVIGMSDGLTVPFALAAGLSGAVGSTRIIVTAGVAEIVAGAIAMGLGGYLAAKSDSDHYQSELIREHQEIRETPEAEKAETEALFKAYGLTTDETRPVVEALSQRPEDWVDFMMRFELGLEKTNPKRALTSALTIAGAYAIGGLLPLSPYMILAIPKEAFINSVIITLTALWIFGFLKGRFLGMKPFKSAWQTMIIGGIAAAAAFLIARAIT